MSCSYTHSHAAGFLLPAALLLLALPACYAFGAGSIPDYSYLNDVAYRHGDIEAVIEGLSKVATGSEGGSGLLGAATGLAGAIFGGNNEGGGINMGQVLKVGAAAVAGGAKFSSLDVKRIYLGNFLRDYSQAADIAGLSKLSIDSIVLVITVLSFMVFGYASDEFEITKEKLGVYLPVEHIDNPKGYAADQENGDARPYDSRLRGPVLDEELEIDQNNGMKRYIASDSDRYDTSSACIRRNLQKCIELGRRTRDQPDSLDRYEAYRLLGTALHTCEDLMAHSNWIEIALQKLGYRDVFTHVGDNARVRAPSGDEVPPLVTGTFGSADFCYSLLGEAGDKLSSATVTDVMAKMDDAKQQGNQGEQPIDVIKNVLAKANQGGNSKTEQKLQNAEEVRKNAINLDPDQVASEELQKQLWEVLSLRDDIMKSIESTIDAVPGLNELVEGLTNAITAYILTTIEPFVKPLLSSFVSGLQEGSAAVIERQDQWEVFTNDRADDPTHSVISKDHFDSLLNEPAGQLAQLIVKHTVPIVVNSWYNDEDPNRAIDRVLEVIHHPYWARQDSQIQSQLFDHLRSWLEGKPSNEKDEILQSLTKEAVREGRNKRKGAEEGHSHSHGGGGGKYSVGAGTQWNRRPGGGQSQQQQHQGGGGYAQQQSFNSYSQESSSRRNDDNSGNAYGGQSGGYGRQDNESSGYGRQQNESSGYGRRNDDNDSSDSYGRRQGGAYNSSGYGRRQDADENPYGGGRRQEGGAYDRQDEDSSSYGRRNDESNNSSGYGRQDNESSSYGRRQDADENSYGGGRRLEGGAYGRQDEDSSSYGRRDDESNYSSGYGRQDNEFSSYGRRQDNDENSYGGGRRQEPNDNQGGWGSSGGGYQQQGREDVSERFGQMNVGDRDGEEDGRYGQNSRRGNNYGDDNERRGGYDNNY